MELTKENFVEKFEERLETKYALDVKDATAYELYDTLCSLLKSAYTRK